MVVYRNPEELPPPIGLYSQVARAGNLVFFAGLTALDHQGEVIGKGDFEKQMRASYAEMRQALASEGLTPSDIAQMTTYLVRDQDIAEFYRVRRILYRDLYPDGKYPPHILLVVSRLADEALLIEIQIVAAAL